MTERASAERRLKEAQNLAFSAELLAFCETQRSFIDAGTDEGVLRQRARALAREARRRRLAPETVLLAMQIVGCYRMRDLYPVKVEEAARYTTALSYLLSDYFDPLATIPERRTTPRPPRKESEPPA